MKILKFLKDIFKKNRKAHKIKLKKRRYKRMGIAKSTYKRQRQRIIRKQKETNGFNFCNNCGEFLITNQITIDHIMDIAKGGKSTDDNCQILCDKCNQLKNKYGNRK